MGADAPMCQVSSGSCEERTGVHWGEERGNHFSGGSKGGKMSLKVQRWWKCCPFWLQGCLSCRAAVGSVCSRPLRRIQCITQKGNLKKNLI